MDSHSESPNANQNKSDDHPCINISRCASFYGSDNQDDSIPNYKTDSPLDIDNSIILSNLGYNEYDEMSTESAYQRKPEFQRVSFNCVEIIIFTVEIRLVVINLICYLGHFYLLIILIF